MGENSQDDSASLEQDEDDSSFTSITSMTITVSSQLSQRSEHPMQREDIITEEEEEEEHGHEEADTLMKEIKSQLKSLKEVLSNSDQTFDSDSILRLCEKLSKEYQLEIKALNDNHQCEVHQLIQKLHKLEEENNQNAVKVISLTRVGDEFKIYRKANDDLNQYITDIEKHYSQELGSLKARLSLSRMEKLMEDGSSNASTDSAIAIPKEAPKKKRRSSLLFWRRSSKASKFTKLLDSKTSLESSSQGKALVVDDVVANELKERCVKIEELSNACRDSERKISLLEGTLRNKNIDCGSKKNRIVELTEEVKRLKSHGNKCEELLQVIQKVIYATTQEISNLETDYKGHQQQVKNFCRDLKNLSWNVESLNEANKILLSRVNAKGYELQLERLKIESIIEGATPLLKHILQTSNAENVTIQEDLDNETFLKLAKLAIELVRKNSDTLDQKKAISSQSSYDKFVQTEKCDKVKPKTESVQTQTKLLIERKKSFVNNAENDDDSKNCTKNQNSEMSHEKEKENETEVFNKLADFMSFLQNKDLDQYKKNALSLEEENATLKRSLSQSYKDMEIMQVEFQYQQCRRGNVKRTSNDSLATNSIHSGKIREVLHPSEQKLTQSNLSSRNIAGTRVRNIRQQLKKRESSKHLRTHAVETSHKSPYVSTYPETENKDLLNYSFPQQLPTEHVPTHPENENTNRLNNTFPQSHGGHVLSYPKHEVTAPFKNNTFLHSYERGNSLINDIFQEKEHLERELLQSRKFLPNRRKTAAE